MELGEGLERRSRNPDVQKTTVRRFQSEGWKRKHLLI